ncbi:hypothetical protein G7046_g8295 [Stylonectria norvegica]|nr:hypothetical protein G7046_g8295 [Stylonectria norvegica]
MPPTTPRELLRKQSKLGSNAAISIDATILADIKMRQDFPMAPVLMLQDSDGRPFVDLSRASGVLKPSSIFHHSPSFPIIPWSTPDDRTNSGFIATAVDVASSSSFVNAGSLRVSPQFRFYLVVTRHLVAQQLFQTLRHQAEGSCWPGQSQRR